MAQEATQDECGLQDGLHPVRSTGLEMPQQFAQTPCTLSLCPEASADLGAEGIIAHNEPHATLEIT